MAINLSSFTCADSVYGHYLLSAFNHLNYLMIRFLRSYKIASKVPFFLAVVIFFPVLLAIVANNIASNIHESNKEIYENYLYSIVNMTAARQQIYQEYVLLKSHIIDIESEAMLRHEGDIAEAQEILDAALNLFVFTVAAEDEPESLKSFRKTLEQQRKVRDSVLELSATNRDIEADHIINTQYKALFNVLIEQMADLVIESIEGAEQYYVESTEYYQDMKQMIYLVTGVVILTSVIVGWLIMATIVRPITTVEQGISKIKNSKDLKTQLAEIGDDEITSLSHSFNLMLGALEKAQEQILRSEKLASLGALVAGVSHEINTPIGIAVTMGSTFEQRVKTFVEKLRTGKVRRSDIDNFEKETLEGLVILLQSLDKAAALISSFKQVAVDQTSEEKRSFKLVNLVDEVVLTLNHQIKKTDILCICDISEDIELESYPGPLGQVITNLFKNALIHGFENQHQGEIRIAAKKFGDMVEITVSDNGKGIAEEHIGKVFDPFYTTKLGQGGSGLGLNIIFNIVSGVLSGTIDMNSKVGVGTVFTVKIPSIAH